MQPCTLCSDEIFIIDLRTAGSYILYIEHPYNFSGFYLGGNFNYKRDGCGSIPAKKEIKRLHQSFSGKKNNVVGIRRSTCNVSN